MDTARDLFACLGLVKLKIILSLLLGIGKVGDEWSFSLVWGQGGVCRYFLVCVCGVGLFCFLIKKKQPATYHKL